MNKQILIRYSELTLKGKNRNHFSKVIFNNIKNKLNKNNLEYEIKRHYDQITIVPKDNEEEIVELLKDIVGIS